MNGYEKAMALAAKFAIAELELEKIIKRLYALRKRIAPDGVLYAQLQDPAFDLRMCRDSIEYFINRLKGKEVHV